MKGRMLLQADKVILRLDGVEANVLHSIIQVYIDNFIHNTHFNTMDTKFALKLRDALRQNGVGKIEDIPQSDVIERLSDGSNY